MGRLKRALHCAALFCRCTVYMPSRREAFHSLNLTWKAEESLLSYLVLIFQDII